MMSLLTTVLMSLGILALPASNCSLPTAPAVEVAPVPAVMPGSDEATDVAPETYAPSRTVGPFGSYAAAADYADYLEIELGYDTRVIRSGNGWYYVIYW